MSASRPPTSIWLLLAKMYTYFFIPVRSFMLVTPSISGQLVHPVLTQLDPGDSTKTYDVGQRSQLPHKPNK